MIFYLSVSNQSFLLKNQFSNWAATFGLILGKPIGVMLFSFIAISLSFSKLPAGVNWRHLLGAGVLGGIGFTMSIFITNLAFDGLKNTIDSSKVAIMAAPLIAGLLGYIWLRYKSIDQP